MEKIKITREEHIVTARLAARNQATFMGMSMLNKTRVATAVSELARNIYKYGGGGWMEIDIIENAGRKGLRCIFIDEGPGINDVELALSDGFTTGKGLGQGLPGSKRLMDEFMIDTGPGQGTRIEVIKWI